ncbi:vWA domain-containing protein [Yoonia sp. BS5-3]|uniref:VWA domain-containing protein n=1 Tax=Yoonia phaeophyticola TaxID=3137369 RepID=A0ABZ2V5W6_9RHOB
MQFTPKTLLMLGPLAVVAACSAPSYGPPPVSVLEESAINAPVAAPEVLAAPVLVDSAPSVIERRIVKPAPAPTPQVSAGVLTAGDIDDTLNLARFLRYQDEASETLGWRAAALDAPIMAQLRGPSGAPAPGVRFTLRKPGEADPFYDGYSGVDGRITVFPRALGAGRPRQIELHAFPEAGGPAVAAQLQTGTGRQVVTLPSENAWSPDFMDLVFVIDATGSMGDELKWLSEEIGQISRAARTAAPGVDIRYGLVVYRSPGDPQPVRNYGFTNNINQFTSWVAAQNAWGGAGGPEMVAHALDEAVQLNWRRGKGERLLFQIGDEPPRAWHAGRYYSAAETAAANGIQVFGLAASGTEASLEYLMRQGSVMTGGRYLFLTDDSGVGLSHAEPTISCYQVTRLNDLMIRVLRSELSGRRVEAPAADVIREVGSYQGGICRD